MDDTPRSERRRQARRGVSRPVTPGIFRRRDVIAVAAIAGGILGSVALIALLSGGDGSGPGGTSATLDASITAAPAFVPTTPDELAIETLARRSIEVLPQGEWPSLYDDFTPEFQQRCPRQDFADGGARNATELGASLSLLAYKRLEQLAITGDSASAVVVGEIRGQREYSVQTAFSRVSGTWKLAPAPQTGGCAAFNRLD
jgi:hypothetical protein